MGYALEGDWVNAGISAAGAIPVVGDLAKAGRVGKKVVQELVDGGSGQAAKQEAKNVPQKQRKRQVSDSRNEFKKVREEYWKREARENPDKYSSEDLERMRQGKAPIIPTARSEFTIAPPPAGSPRFARGTAHGFGSPCSQGEP